MDIISWIKTTLSKYSSNSTHDKNAIYFVKNEDGKTGKIISDEVVYGNGDDANGVVVESPNQPTEGESVWVNPDEDPEEVAVYNRSQVDAIHQSIVNSITSLSEAGYLFSGVATSETNPGTPDAKVFYIANGKGTYEKFGGLEVTEDEVVVLYWDSAWHKVATGIASNEKLTELEYANADMSVFSVLRKYIDGSGVIVGGGSYNSTPYLPIKDAKYAVYYATFENKASARPWALYDANKNLVAIAPTQDGTLHRFDIAAIAASYPTATQFVLCNYKTDTTAKLTTKADEDIIAEASARTLADNNIISAQDGEVSLLDKIVSGKYASLFSERCYYSKDGVIHNGGNYMTTKFIDLNLLNGVTITYDHNASASAAKVSLFDANLVFVGYTMAETNAANLRSQFPTAKYARFSLFNQNESTLSVVSDIDARISESAKTYLGAPTPLAAKMFQRVGCIGDSYTAGFIIKGATLANNTYPSYSWPHHMKQLTGHVWDNYGLGGSTAKQWVLGAARLNEVQQSGHKCQAYVVGLMINDINAGNPYYTPLGSVADIGTNADTYYAYYYKLVKAIVEVNPNAKIFCNTCPKVGATYRNYNQAVRDIVKHCHDTEGLHVYCCDIAGEKYFTEAYYGNQLYTDDYLNGHYSAIGYEFMAECYVKVLSDVVIENLDEMQDIHLVPYDEPTDW